MTPAKGCARATISKPNTGQPSTNWTTINEWPRRHPGSSSVPGRPTPVSQHYWARIACRHPYISGADPLRVSDHSQNVMGNFRQSPFEFPLDCLRRQHGGTLPDAWTKSGWVSPTRPGKPPEFLISMWSSRMSIRMWLPQMFWERWMTACEMGVQVQLLLNHASLPMTTSTNFAYGGVIATGLGSTHCGNEAISRAAKLWVGDITWLRDRRGRGGGSGYTSALCGSLAKS